MRAIRQQASYGPSARSKQTVRHSVVVDDEDLVGQEATIVILDNGGNMLAQAATRIGG